MSTVTWPAAVTPFDCLLTGGRLITMRDRLYGLPLPSGSRHLLRCQQGQPITERAQILVSEGDVGGDEIAQPSLGDVDRPLREQAGQRIEPCEVDIATADRVAPGPHRVGEH